MAKIIAMPITKIMPMQRVSSNLPDELQGSRYYYPVDRGLEQKIKAKLEQLRQLDEKSH